MRRSLIMLGLIGAIMWAWQPSTSLIATAEAEETYTFCGSVYRLPGDIYGTLPTSNVDLQQAKANRYSWDSFLALNAPGIGETVNRWGDNKTQWQHWSSTVDLIECQADPASCVCPGGICGRSGVRYYPEACQQVSNFQNYRALAEVAKVDDLFLEADTGGGLSNDPVIDSEGKFVRYEIMINPVMQRFVVQNQYYDRSVLEGLTEPVTFPCGNYKYTGGDPANSGIGSIVLKNAWMELGSRDPADYHTEDLLVFTPSYRNSTGVASCELKTMALVGAHMVRKTVKQPNWTWSTFEHAKNAPACDGLPPAGNASGGSGPNTACPTSVRYDYNFYPASCSEGMPGNEACQSCNVVPVSNAEGCTNPNVLGDTSWCLDQPPASNAGYSKLCRQVPLPANHPTAYTLNLTCDGRLGPRSVWSNYELVGTQWQNIDSKFCQTLTTADRSTIEPQIDIPFPMGDTRPYLGNTSMESYNRSDCLGCHSKAVVANVLTNPPQTDMMWWLQLEVGGADITQ